MAVELTSEIVKAYGTDAGADVVGVAASDAFSEAAEGFRPADVLRGCRSVIVFGSTFSPEVFRDIDEYTTCRNARITAMTEIANKVAKRIKADGHKSKAISAIGGKTVERGGNKEHFGHISLKHAAQIAGLGFIGKNYLLTNQRYGNLLWLSAVLTDAELTPDSPVLSDMCEDCNICVNACPEGALNDPASFGKKACSKHFVVEDRKLRIKCYLCRTICPHGLGSQVL